jgi:hypothetical protein
MQGGEGFSISLSPLNFFLDLANEMCIMEDILNETQLKKTLLKKKLNLDNNPQLLYIINYISNKN